MSTTSQNYAIKQGYPRILIIDDDPDDQILLKIAFDCIAENLCLHFASCAQEALDYLEKTKELQLPNLMVTDYHLPKYNGLRFIQQLNAMERYRGMHKVILSNSIYFPGMDRQKNFAGNIFAKPDSFDHMKQLAGQLLQLCLDKENVRT